MRPQNIVLLALTASSASAAPVGFGSFGSGGSTTSSNPFSGSFGGGSTSGGSTTSRFGNFFGGGSSNPFSGFFGGSSTGGSTTSSNPFGGFFGGGSTTGGTTSNGGTTNSGSNSTSSPASPGTSACPSIEILSARGTTEPQSGSAGMRPIFTAISSTISPLTSTVYNVVYPADFNFATGPATGATDIVNRINSQSSKCPNQKFVLAGYSQGAMVVVQAMNKLTDQADKIPAVIMFGDPYYNPSSAASAGTAKGSGGSSGGLSLGGSTSIPSAFVGKTKDYCDSGDAVCQTHTFTITATHLGYGSKYAQDAAQFVASKVK
ncbi:hypothetical protein HDV00_003279 [Rhizophlyctis rosea]|nr:hypothetical protein HDV00_003279 [Rhizophlyctis rosea]